MNRSALSGSVSGLLLLASAAIVIGGCTASVASLSPNPTGTPAAPTASPSPSPVTASRGSYVSTGSLSAPRTGHTATLLADGRVLVAGGTLGEDTAPTASAEVYDPTTGAFSSTGSMSIARVSHTATRMKDGRVLIVGGSGPDQGAPLASAEIYDPATGTFTATGTLSAPRKEHTATLLNDGRVLVAGGMARTSSGFTVTASAEIYDPNAGKFGKTGSMRAQRLYHRATLLTDGRVLITGGQWNSGGLSTVEDPILPADYTRRAEIYYPATGRFTATGTLASDRSLHAATLLGDGRVLIAGPESTGEMGEQPLASAEVFGPTTGKFGPTGDLGKLRTAVNAVALADGRVLIIGNGLSEGLSAEFYDPRAGAFSPADGSTGRRSGHTVTLLANGRVLIVGGQGDWTESGYTLASAEIYWP